MAETKKNWYVLRAVSGKEAKLKEYIEAEIKHNTLLQQHVSQVLIPMEKHATLRNGKRVERRRSVSRDTFLLKLPSWVMWRILCVSCPIAWVS